MVPVLPTYKFILHRSTLCSVTRLLPLIDSHRNLNVSPSLNKENEDGVSKADEARRKLQQLLRETRGNKHLKDKKPSQETSKKVKIAQPKLNKYSDKRGTENVDGLDPKMVYAAHRVAASLDSNTNNTPIENEDNRQRKVRKVESDLLKKLKTVHAETEDAKSKGEAAAQKDLKSLFSSLKIEKDPDRTEKQSDDIKGYEATREGTHGQVQRRASPKKDLTQEQIAFLEKRRRLRQAQQVKDEEAAHVPIDLFNSQPPLGIFNKSISEPAESKQQVEMTMWNKCRERELKILSSSAPKNLLEEMAIKTDQGILWEFPINNEQGIDQDKIEPFHSHVFLDHHLEPWCPKKGPVRHFMELVCVGLSKNPYITVEKKIEHLNWYKNYFEDPEHDEILRISGAIE